jgi:hypothetical protein
MIFKKSSTKSFSKTVLVGLFYFLFSNVALGQVTFIPEIEFQTMDWFDQYLCPRDFKEKIDPIWKTEGEKRIPELKNTWDNTGKELLKVTQNLIGKVFGFEKKTANLFYCPGWPAWNMPLMIPLSPYLKTAHPSGPLPDIDFVDNVFHQLLHPYILKLLPWTHLTPSLEANFHESFATLFHLHLYAIQKEVYLELGRQDLWQMVVEKNKAFGASYKRAVDIVEEQGTKTFIQELRQY